MPQNAWSRFADVVCGRRTRWAVLVVVLLAFGALAAQAGKLGEVKDNDPAAALPRGADSRVVAELAWSYPSVR